MTLEQRLWKREPIPISEALSILRRCAEELDAWHASGRLHINFNPRQVKWDESGAVVTGFDSEREVDPEPMVGVPAPQYAAYLSPEEILGTQRGPRSDEFSLAVVAFQMITSQLPFEGNNISALFYEICAGEPKNAHLANARVPVEASAVFERALSKDPDARFPSCTEFVNELEAALSKQVDTSLTPQMALPPVTPTPAAPPPIAAAPTTPAFELPPARRRVYGEPLAEEREEAPKRRSAVLTTGLIAFGAAVLFVLAALLFHWRAKPDVPVQVLDTNNAPTAPPPASSDQQPSTSAPPPAPVTPPSNTAPPSTTATRPNTTARQSPTYSQGAPNVATPPAPRTSHREPAPDSTQVGQTGTGTVEFLTQPPGASLSIDGGRLACTTPCTEMLTPGRHVLSATLDGYSTAQRIFHVPEENSVIISLAESMGTVIVTSVPSGASIMVDGRRSGSTPLTLHLRAGQHRLDAFLGSQARQQVLNVQADAIQGATFDLR